MKISIIGSGYVGLVTGVCLAEKGHSILCVDSDSEKVASINQGVPPIFEQDLEKLLKKLNTYEKTYYEGIYYLLKYEFRDASIKLKRCLKSHLADGKSTNALFFLYILDRLFPETLLGKKSKLNKTPIKSSSNKKNKSSAQSKKDKEA